VGKIGSEIEKSENELRWQVKTAIIKAAFSSECSALFYASILAPSLLVSLMAAMFGWSWWWCWGVLGLIISVLPGCVKISGRAAQKDGIDFLRRRRGRYIETDGYRDQVVQAHRYWGDIVSVLNATPGILGSYLRSSAASVAESVSLIFALAQRLDTYERSKSLHRDMEQLPNSIAELQGALTGEADPSVCRQIEATLAAKKEQEENLLALQKSMEQAKLHLEEILASLGTVCSQFQVVRAQRIRGGSTAPSLEGVHSQVERLQDLITSIDQIYGRFRY